MIGALLHYITHAEPKEFQPMKANMGLLPEMEERIRSKEARYGAYAERARGDLAAFIERHALQPLFAGEPLPTAVEALPTAPEPLPA
jgi:hypothetical protein